MRFNFEYRTSDNVRHHGTVSASSRDDAYATLKARGIRPSQLDEAPGFFNKLLGKYKRWIAIVVLAFVSSSAVVTVLMLKNDVDQLAYAPRSQIYGDPSIIQKCEQKRWANVFSDVGELLLSRFAEPGKVATMPLGDEDVSSAVAALLQGLNRKVLISATDAPEVQKMKRIVNGMKAELAQYVSAGGSVSLYVERLGERQKVEANILKNALDDFSRFERMAEKQTDKKSLIEKWNQKNEMLRGLGLPSVPLPDSWEDEIEKFEKSAPEGLTNG